MTSTRWLTAFMLMICLPATSQIPINFPFLQGEGLYHQEVEAGTNLDLILAAERGDRDSVLLLIREGYDVNETTGEGVSALMYAAGNGFLEITMILVENGAEINAEPANGITALSSACINNHYETALFLLQNGADTEIADYLQVTPLMYAVAHDYFEITELLLMFGADPMHTDLEGSTALHAAALYAGPDIAWLLIEYGGRVNATDYFGFTPLMTAIQAGRNEMFEYLLLTGATIHVRSADGISPLALAIATSQFPVAEKLIELGADPKQEISWSKNLMNLARQRGNEKMIRLLEMHNVRPNLMPDLNTVRLSANSLLNMGDYFNGLQAGIEDDKYKLLLTAGWYTRPVRRRVLVDSGEGLYDQLWEQRHLFFGSLHKAFPMKYSLSLNEDGFYLGFNVLYSKGRYWGTYRYPEPRWHLVPSAGYYKAGSWWFYNLGYEYLRLNIPSKSNHRLRIGIGIRLNIKRDPVIYRTTYW
jgi:ankyrin repeat protein